MEQLSNLKTFHNLTLQNYLPYIHMHNGYSKNLMAWLEMDGVTKKIIRLRPVQIGQKICNIESLGKCWFLNTWHGFQVHL